METRSETCWIQGCEEDDAISASDAGVLSQFYQLGRGPNLWRGTEYWNGKCDPVALVLGPCRLDLEE